MKCFVPFAFPYFSKPCNLLFYFLACKYIYSKDIQCVCVCLCLYVSVCVFVCLECSMVPAREGRGTVECSPSGSQTMVYMPGDQARYDSPSSPTASGGEVPPRSRSCSFLHACQGDQSSQFARDSSAFNTECLEYREAPQSWAHRTVGHPVLALMGTVILCS